MKTSQLVRLLTRLLWLCSCALAAAPTTFLNAERTKAQSSGRTHEVANLSIGETVSAKLAATQSVSYELSLPPGRHLRGFIEKGDLSVTLTVFDPEGVKLCELSGRRYGRLSFFFITRTQGNYRLEVSALERDSLPRSFSLKIEETRDATALDAVSMTAQQLYAEAEGLRAVWREQPLREAVEKYAAAAERWRAAARPAEMAAALEAGGDVYFTLSEYARALEQYRAALEVWRAAGDLSGEIESLNKIGYSHIYLGENRQATECFRRVMSLNARGRIRDSTGRVKAQTLNNLGEVEYARGALSVALDHFGGALAAWTVSSDRSGQALAHLNLGYTYLDSGDLINGQQHIERAFALSREKNERRLEALSLTAGGIVRAFRGEQRQALYSHQRALELFQIIGDRQGIGVTLNSIGQTYEDSHDPRRALDYYSRALVNYDQNGNRDAEAVTRYYIGRVYRALGDEANALAFYERAIELCRELGKLRLEAYASMGLATVRGLRGESPPALAMLRRVMKLFQEIGDKRGQALALNATGYILQQSGEVRAAQGVYRRALSFSRAAGDRYLEASTLYNAARAARDMGLLKKAMDDVEESLRISESLRTNVATQELRTTFLASVHERYELHIDLLMQMHKGQPDAGHDKRALLVSEWARARSLRELLGEARVDLRQGVAHDLVERERSLRDMLAAKVEYQVRLQSNEATDDVGRVENEIRQLMAQYEEVRAEIRERSPRYATLTQPQPLHLEEVQAELRGEETLLLEFALGEPRSYVWAVTATSVTSHELPGRSEIDAAAHNLYKLLTARQPVKDESEETFRARVEYAESRYGDEADRLSRMILEPVGGQLTSKRLLVVADGWLQYIPFDALPVPFAPAPAEDSGDMPEPPLLVFRQEVVNLPSASTLALLRRDPAPHDLAPGEQIAVLADPVFETNDPRVAGQHADPTGTATPQTNNADNNAYNDNNSDDVDTAPVHWRDFTRLPATLGEADIIRQTMPPGAVKVITGLEARREIVVGGGLSSYGVLHFATHGVINSSRPDLSGILLSTVNEQGGRENGYLQLHDVYNLDLRARLVVLSACDTALGKEIRGEGLIGLTRGFMYAGSKTVVASLWKVDDSATAELMRHFYDAMQREGATPSVALHRAKVKLWRQGRWRSPYFWAAFTLQGEHRGKITATSPGRNHGRIAVACGFVLALGLAFFLLRHRLFVSGQA